VVRNNVNYSFITLIFSVALQALKRKKRYEKQLQQIDGTLSTIELQREALEGATSNTAVFQAMNEAAKSLKGVHQSLYVCLSLCLSSRLNRKPLILELG